MKIENSLRWGGLAALLAGVLLLVSQLLDVPLLNSLPFELSGGELAIYGFLGIDGYLGLLLVVLMQLGLVGLYAPQAKAAGVPGMVGLFMAFAGTRLAMDPSFVDPILVKSSVWLSGGEPARFWWELAIFGLTFVLGWVLFGVATLRTGAYPRMAAALLVIGAPLLLLAQPLSGVIFAVAVAWMGYVLFIGRNQGTAQPTGNINLGVHGR